MMNAIYQWFAEPLAFPFMQQALIIGLVVAIICATLSCYLVLKGWSLMGDAISHAVLPGIVLAYMLYPARNWSVFLWCFLYHCRRLFKNK